MNTLGKKNYGIPKKKKTTNPTTKSFNDKQSRFFLCIKINMDYIYKMISWKK